MEPVRPVRPSFKTHGAATFEDRTHAGTRRRVVAEITTVKVNLEVWQIALDLADGDNRRIEVLGETDVLVHNQRVR